MKHLFYLALSIILVSCATASKTITITNTANFDREKEMVEVKLSDLGTAAKKSFILVNEANAEVPYQIIDNEILIFQAGVKANKTSNYSIKPGTPAEVKALVSARHVPERLDDFAWENDLAAYRMYGPALASQKPSNGVDLWLKRTNELIVDKFYHDELVNKKSYHVDHGLGLDCYKVGAALGAGGIAPYVDGKLLIGKHYDKFEVLMNGPLRAEFKLTYNAFVTGQQSQKKSIIIRTEAGSLLNKAIVRYEGNNAQQLAGGIFLHDGKGILKQAENFIAYAEYSVSDAGIPSGRNYVGVLIPQAGNAFANDGTHAMIINNYAPNTDFVYYFGGGWSKWGFATDEDWFNAMEKFDAALKNPLQVKVK